MTSSIQELVAQARSQIRNLAVDEFARELEAETVTLIDGSGVELQLLPGRAVGRVPQARARAGGTA